MLIEFSVGNYLSFKDTVTLSMVAGESVTRFEEDNVIQADKYRLLKSVAIYGANASGKTNLIKAMEAMREIILNSIHYETDDLPIEHFKLNVETENRPSFFEIVFLTGNKTYRYGFEVTKQEIKTEWLFVFRKTTESALFIREEGKIEIKRGFREGKKHTNRVIKNVPFISLLAGFQSNIAQEIINYFASHLYIFGLREKTYPFSSYKLNTDESLTKTLQAKIQGLLRCADLGIANLSVPNTNIHELLLLGEKVYDGEYPVQLSEVLTVHDKLDHSGNKTSTATLNLKQQGEGTEKYVQLIGYIVLALNSGGGTLIIDQLDAKLHPVLSNAITKLFNSKEINPDKVQLIFTTYNSQLLDSRVLRRDQIYFTEKNRFNATDLYSLLKFKIGDEELYQQDYINGRYGAIPFLGDFHKVMTD